MCRAPPIFALFYLYNAYAIHTYLSDLSNESGADSEEPLDTGTHWEHRTGLSTSPHHQQSASFIALLEQLGDLEVCGVSSS